MGDLFKKNSGAVEIGMPGSGWIATGQVYAAQAGKMNHVRRSLLTEYVPYLKWIKHICVQNFTEALECLESLLPSCILGIDFGSAVSIG